MFCHTPTCQFRQNASGYWLKLEIKIESNLHMFILLCTHEIKSNPKKKISKYIIKWECRNMEKVTNCIVVCISILLFVYELSNAKYRIRAWQNNIALFELETIPVKSFSYDKWIHNISKDNIDVFYSTIVYLCSGIHSFNCKDTEHHSQWVIYDLYTVFDSKREFSFLTFRQCKLQVRCTQLHRI